MHGVAFGSGVSLQIRDLPEAFKFWDDRGLSVTSNTRAAARKRPFLRQESQGVTASKETKPL